MRMPSTQKSSICIRALHSYQRAFKELELFSSDLLALSSERLPLHAIFVHNITESSTKHVFGSLKPILLATSKLGVHQLLSGLGVRVIIAVSCHDKYISVTARLS